MSNSVSVLRTALQGAAAPLAQHARGAFCACHCANPVARLLHQRVMASLSRRAFLGGMSAAMLAFVGLGKGESFAAQPEAPDRPLLLTNLRLFDGVSGQLRDGVQVLVKGNRIVDVLAAGEQVADARLIDCGGRVVMPGLIDVHWHSMLCGLTAIQALTADLGYVYLVAAREAERTLLRGFTSIRDAGGPAFALKRAIDEGIVTGPRIFPSGAMISQTAGHGDFRLRHEIPRTSSSEMSRAEALGVTIIADGSDEVLRRVREQLLLGASQIKLMAGGGVTSFYDPLDTIQYTEAELRTAVQAAQDWGTYVMVHVYQSAGIERALRAGVRCIEHGQLADEKAARSIADAGAWWSLQPFFGDEDANPKPDPQARLAQMEVAEGTVRAYELAKRFNIRTAWGTDILFSPQSLHTQGKQLAKLTRFYDPLELLQMATARNGELLAMAGARNPYPGALGVIAAGAMADLLVVDGDPARSLDFLADPDTNLRLIMKDGRIYKDTL